METGQMDKCSVTLDRCPDAETLLHLYEGERMLREMKEVKLLFESLLRCCSRERLVEMFSNEYFRLELMPSSRRDQFRELFNNETFHVRHVRSVMSLLTGKENFHDHSKNGFTISLLTLWFNILPEQLKTGPLSEWVGKEINRHYRMENGHHPEKALFCPGFKFDAESLLEMAIDRASRSLQFSDRGEIEDESMKFHEPKFQEDHEKLVGIYWELYQVIKKPTKETWDMLKRGAEPVLKLRRWELKNFSNVLTNAEKCLKE